MRKFHKHPAPPTDHGCSRGGVLKSEKGVVLVMVVILSAVVLAVMTALVYMITTQSKISGMQKQYKTALEAARGGADIFYDLINLRGDPLSTATYQASLNAQNLSPVIPPNGACNSSGNVGLSAKLLTVTNTWVNCDNSMNIDYNNQATYDLSLKLGSGAVSYSVYAKITSTIVGNSGNGPNLYGDPTVNAGTNISAGFPYLYSIEVLALNNSNPQERARLSIAYQY